MKLSTIAFAILLAAISAFVALFIYVVFILSFISPGGPSTRDSWILFVFLMPLFGSIYLIAALLMKSMMKQKNLNAPLKFAGIFLLLGPLWAIAVAIMLAGIQAPCFLGGGELLDFTAWDPVSVRCSIPDPHAGETCDKFNYTICKYGCMPTDFDYRLYNQETDEYNGVLEGTCLRHYPHWCGYPLIKEKIQFRYCPV